LTTGLAGPGIGGEPVCEYSDHGFAEGDFKEINNNGRKGGKGRDDFGGKSISKSDADPEKEKGQRSSLDPTRISSAADFLTTKLKGRGRTTVSVGREGEGRQESTMG